MLDLNYPAPDIPGPVPPTGRRPYPEPDRCRRRMLDALEHHPFLAIVGWFLLVAAIAGVLDRPEWATYGIVLPAMIIVALAGLALGLRLILGRWSV